MILTDANPSDGGIDLSSEEQALLHCHAGDTVRTLSLNVRKNQNV